MARKIIFCIVLHQERQIIKERRSTRVHENHRKRLYGRYFYQKKLSRKPMESGKREFKRKRSYVGGTKPLLRNHTLARTPNL
mgnify:CR=1 FL=1